MKFVELVISPTQRYAYKNASDIEMNILGDFLASDVGYRPLPFRQWAFNFVSENANGSLTALEKKGDTIILTDIFSKEESAVELTMTHQQFVQILNDWQEKVCNVQPKAIIIEHENNKFTIRLTAIEPDHVVAQQPTEPLADSIAPHSYPAWIKNSFYLCCILFVISLFKFPYYFKLNYKVKKAVNAFKSEDYSAASRHFRKLSAKLPTNKPIKLHLAQSLFKSEYSSDHVEALNCLKQTTLETKEWNELLKYMPAQYTAYFEDKRGNKK